MTIYFSANCRNLSDDRELYEKIASIVAKNGWAINNSWLEVAEAKLAKTNDWTDICYEAMSGIERADAMIVDATGQSAFGVGYEVAMAVQKGIPVLILCKEGSSSYANGLRQELIYYRSYEDKELEVIIGNFLRVVRREKVKL